MFSQDQKLDQSGPISEINFLPRAIDAVIFDMDGVLTDTEPVHFAATNSVLKAEGFEISWEQYEPFIGTAEPSMWDFLERQFRLNNTRDSYRDAYNLAVLALLQEKVDALPGAHEAVRSVRAAGLRVGLASSSRQAWVEATLRGAAFEGAFEVIVSGDMVERGKPAPDIFLRAASLLAVDPDRCLVLEDSPRGIAGAKAAGMKAIGVRSRYQLDLSAADDIVDSIAAFDIEDHLHQQYP